MKLKCSRFRGPSCSPCTLPEDIKSSSKGERSTIRCSTHWGGARGACATSAIFAYHVLSAYTVPGTVLGPATYVFLYFCMFSYLILTSDLSDEHVLLITEEETEVRETLLAINY